MLIHLHLWLLSYYNAELRSSKWVNVNPQSLKYLLVGSLQKFADPQQHSIGLYLSS